MDRNTINKVKEIVDSAKREDGWTELATIGTLINANGINIRTHGYGKLKAFIEDMDDAFELSTDIGTGLPIVRVLSYSQNRPNNTHDISLYQWAYINSNHAISKLEHDALHEEWNYGENTSDTPFPILKQYLKWTFVKLWRENKILYANNYAAFNTGLVDSYYKPIFAVFDRNRNQGQQQWHFIDFCVAGGSTPASRILSNNFSVLPHRAVYIRRYDDVMFDCSLPVDCNWEHILEDHIERIPNSLLQQVCSGFDIKSTAEMNQQEEIEYYNSLKEHLSSSPDKLALLSSMMNMALELAKVRVEWNYKTAIPVYYPTTDSVNLILPLALNTRKPEQISLALVTTKTPANRYRGVTIFTLDMAYSNARLITKPSSDWLIPEKITTQLM